MNGAAGMAIVSSVGENGNNSNVDVKVVQAGLNQVSVTSFSLKKPLVVDGKIGKKTNGAINDFQKDVVKLSAPDGRIDPDGRTLETLKKSITKGLNLNALLAIMAMGKSSTIKTYLPLLQTALPKYQLNTPLRVCHFFAQIGHESMSFVYTREIASGAAYEGRSDLGNTQKGDGVRFKGRGLIQLTGRDNYRKYGGHISIDLLKKGNEHIIATTPKYALDVSLWFWKSRKLNRYADRDDLKAVTRRVNGGYNGLVDRQAYLNRARFFLV